MAVAGAAFHLVEYSGGRPIRDYAVGLRPVGSDCHLESETHDTLVLGSGGGCLQSGAYLVQGSSDLAGRVTIAMDQDTWLAEKDGAVSFRVEPLPPIEPIPEALTWASPFLDAPRDSREALRKRLVSAFGAKRTSYGRKHKHAGVDLRAAYSENIHPIATGRVVFLGFRDPDGMVILRHRLPDGSPIYTKYVHLKEPQVRVGQVVVTEDVLARAFTESEFRGSGFTANHLHLEIRRSYDDAGEASSHSTTVAELERFCFDPVEFLGSRLAR